MSLSNRVKLVTISHRRIASLLTITKDGTADSTIRGLPDGASLRYVFPIMNGFEPAYGLMFEHENFPEIPDGDRIPELSILKYQHRLTPEQNEAQGKSVAAMNAEAKNTPSLPEIRL